VYSIKALAFTILCMTASYANAIECSGSSGGRDIKAQIDRASLQGTLAIGADTMSLNCKLDVGIYRCVAVTEHTFYKVTISFEAGVESGYIVAEGRYIIVPQIRPAVLTCKNSV